MAGGIARTVTAEGYEAASVARDLLAGLDGDRLVLVIVFADWRIDTEILARSMQENLRAPVVGCTTIGVIDSHALHPSAAAIGLYGDRVRVGIGIAPDLPKAALAQGRNAVHTAAAALGITADRLDPARHVAVTLVDGSCGHEEAFCIASAATAPQIRMVGGSAATEVGSTTRRACVWANGTTLTDAGIVILLETTLPFEAVTSQHMLPTDVKTVVTSATGRVIDELDGRPAAARLKELVAQLGGTLDESRPSEYAFARFIDDVPYLRSLIRVEDDRIHLASAVTSGHVLRLMRPGDLIAKTAQDLAAVRDRIGGEMCALIAFSCIARHWEAAARGIEQRLVMAYAAYPTIGMQSFGEQTGMLLVNHTLTGLAIASPSSAGTHSDHVGSTESP